MRKDKAKHCFALTQGESYARLPITKYAFMQKHRNEHRTSRMAKVFDVSLSEYYDWLKRGISLLAQHKKRCELLVKSAHIDTQESYGHERLHQHPNQQGHDISRYMLRKIKHEKGIYCKRQKRFKTTTDSNQDKPVYDNLLKQEFTMNAPNI